jgi:hypothetical protein
MSDRIGRALSVFMGLSAIMNPIASAPIALRRTADDSPSGTGEGNLLSLHEKAVSALP